MYTRIKRWFESPVFPDDEEKTAQARTMTTVGLYFASVLVVAAVVLVPLFAKHKIESWAFILTLLFLYGIARHLVLRGQLIFARTLMITSAWMLFVGVAIVGGGISSPLMYAVVALTIVIGLLFEPRIGNIFLIASILAGLGLAILQQGGVVLPRLFVFSPITSWFLFALALAFINGLTNLVVGNLQNALARERQQNAARQQAEADREKLIEELARSNAELQQFAYVASHDLQEPLRMVTSYLQLLQRRYEGKLDSNADEFIGFAVDGAERMRELIKGLLDYSRVSTHGHPFELVDCQAILDKTCQNLKLVIEESGAIITQDGLPQLWCDPIQLGQLFQNLVGNAIKFRRQLPPEIHIGAERQNELWQFSVRDNGIGIQPQYAERIFMIFQRLHTRDVYPGTGIGLALCKRIVERHGGRIWLESQPGLGSTFYFTLGSSAPLQ